MSLRTEQAQAIAVIGRWYSAHKCHRIDQLMHDHPEFASDASRYYDTIERTPSKGDMILDLITRDVPGVVEAVIAADRRSLQKRIDPAALAARNSTGDSLSL